MKYTSIITPNDLARYADTRENEGVIPELIYLLIKQSAPDIRECRIPYGDAVNQARYGRSCRLRDRIF